MAEGVCIHILCLDPSTDITGAALLRCTYRAGVRPDYDLLRWHAADAGHIDRSKSDLTARLRRIRWTANELQRWLDSLPYAIHLVAYELDTGRGHAVSTALIMAAGNYLCAPALDGVKSVAITRQAACKDVGCAKIYREPKGDTAAEQAAKKRRLKTAVIVGVSEIVEDFISGPDGPFTLEQEAVADALAVGVAAGNQWAISEGARIATAAARKGSRK